MWPCTTTCATSAGVTGSDTAATVAQNVRRGSSQPDDAWARAGAKAGESVSESAAATAPGAAARASDDASTAPERAGLVLVALILVAAVANLNLSVANVALPDIGKHFDSSQTTLDLIAVGYSLGLAVLGALARRARRPLRPQADAPARHGARDPDVAARRVRAVRHRALRRPASAAGSPPAWPTRRRWR